MSEIIQTRVVYGVYAVYTGSLGVLCSIRYLPNDCQTKPKGDRHMGDSQLSLSLSLSHDRERRSTPSQL